MKKEYKSNAFDRDSNSEMGDLFLQVRDFVKVCIGNNVREKHSENITSFFSEEGGFCYLKAYDAYIHIGWFRGRFINDKYNQLFGKGKSIRGQKVYKFDIGTRETIKYYTDETFIFLVEHNELIKMKKSIYLKI